EYCSLACVRRAHKRRNPSAASGGSASKVMRTQEAKSKPTATVTSAAPAQQPQQQKPESKSSTGKRVFRWTEYLNVKNNGYAAPIHLFLNPFPISTNCFELGMKLEAIDPENCSLFCVCTIVEVRGYRLKLSFDGYSSMYDFWVNADSMDIFPPGWCERTSRLLQPPKGMQPERFSWCRYLVKTNAKAAPRALFTHLNDVAQPDLNGFSVGMHLEAEDLNDTGKICVATVADKLDERIRVHFDGWDDCYDFWVHVNSPYIHHCGW
ncbi:Scm, partial [Drosophila busckii]